MRSAPLLLEPPPVRPQFTLPDVLARLSGVRRVGREFRALCPVHGDRTPSLYLREGPRGLVLMRCRSHHCRYADILAAIGLRPGDLAAPPESYAQRAAREAQAHWAQQLARARAADKALALWRRATAASPDHPYLIAKQIAPWGARELRTWPGLEGPVLVVPVEHRTSDGRRHLWSLEAIGAARDEAGQWPKRFLADGRTRGGTCALRWPRDGTAPARLELAEGFATAATIAIWCPDSAVVCAFFAHNLTPAARALRLVASEARLRVWEDEDPAGRAEARRAAREVGGTVMAWKGDRGGQ